MSGAAGRALAAIRERRLGWPLLFAAVVTALLAVRIRYGVDITDEGIYAVLPLRFVQGARPFIDELSPLQGSGVAMMPFVWLFTTLAAGTGGLILALRSLYLVLTLVAAATSFVFLRRIAPERVALAVSFVPVAFIPWGMPSAGYGNLAMLATAISIATAGVAMYGEARRPWLWAFWAGLASAFAALCYPTTVVALLLALVWLSLVSRSWRTTLAFLVGCAVVGVPAIAFLARGVAGIPSFLAFVRAATSPAGSGGAPTYAGGLAKIPRLAGQAVAFLLALKRVWVLLAIALVLRPRPRWAPLAIAFGIAWSAIPVLVLKETASVPTTMATMLHLTALLVYLLLPSTRRPALTWALAMATVYAVVIIYSSTGEFEVWAVGSLTALPAILLVLLSPALSMRPSGAWRRLSSGVSLGSVGLVLTVAVACMGLASWQDAAPITMRTPIDWGPWRGTVTTAGRARMLASLRDDLARHAGARDVILAFDENPGVYLLTAARPTPTTIWYGSGADNESSAVVDGMFRDIMRARGAVPTVVVRNTLTVTYPAGSLTDAWVSAGYRVVASRPGYDVLVPR